MKKLIEHYTKLGRTDVVEALLNVREGIEETSLPSLSQTLEAAFLWDDTEQGVEFWDDLYLELVEFERK